MPELQFHFDGAGRYVYEQTLPPASMSAWSATATTLWHLYPELGLAARRTVSRFHRAEVAGLTPWALPPAEDLARGADVEAVDAHTVALVPLGAKTRRTDDDKPASYYRVKLIFADDGRLAERRLEEAPAGKVVLREVYDDNGGVRVLDGDGKENGSHRSKVADAAAPDLSADTANLVVLRMPLRSRARVFEDVGLDGSRPLADEWNGCYLVSGGRAGGRTAGRGHDGGQRRRRPCRSSATASRRTAICGAACSRCSSAAGANVCTEPAFQAYVSDHKDDPLARYFALLGNGAYDALHRGRGLDFGARVGRGGQFPRPVGGVPRPGNALAAGPVAVGRRGSAARRRETDLRLHPLQPRQRPRLGAAGPRAESNARSDDAPAASRSGRDVGRAGRRRRGGVHRPL